MRYQKLSKVIYISSPREKNKKKISFFSVNTKTISSHVLKISENSLVLCTREFTDIFITFDGNIFGIHLKKVNILCVFVSANTVCM